jgi:hypothetical protein
MGSAVVLLPAFPSRSCAARNSRQPRPGVRHHAFAISGCRDPRSGRCSLHLQVLLYRWICDFSNPSFPLVAETFVY